jgi:hypothetical protein
VNFCGCGERTNCDLMNYKVQETGVVVCPVLQCTFNVFGLITYLAVYRIHDFYYYLAFLFPYTKINSVTEKVKLFGTELPTSPTGKHFFHARPSLAGEIDSR